MQISQVMSDDVRISNPNHSIRDAAAVMAEIDAGVLPVGQNDRLVGVITDRDIAIRAVAAGKGPDTPVGEIMSKEVLYCFDDDDVGKVAQSMADAKLRRMPVVNRKKRLVGIIALGDIARRNMGDGTAEALGLISRPGGHHAQS